MKKSLPGKLSNLWVSLKVSEVLNLGLMDDEQDWGSLGFTEDMGQNASAFSGERTPAVNGIGSHLCCPFSYTKQ